MGCRKPRDTMAQPGHPQPATRHVAPTHRGTKESVFCNVVGSSSKREAMSLPWGTATRRYFIFSPAFRRPVRPWTPWDEDPNSGKSPFLYSGNLKSPGVPPEWPSPSSPPPRVSRPPLPRPPPEPCCGPHRSCCLGVRCITLVTGVLLEKKVRGASGHQAIAT